MTDRFVELSSARIFVRSWTPERVLDPTPLFLLHDSLGSSELWRDFPERLSDTLGRIVHAYDRWGFGRSTRRDELPSLRFVEEEAEIHFPELLQALDVHDYDLFGHSVGGGMAIAIAAKISGCRSVVTESAQAFVEELTKSGIERARQGFSDPRSFERLARYHGDKADWVLRAWTEVWLSKDFATWSLESLLPRVKCPLLAIHGDRDEYGSAAFPRLISERAGGVSAMKLVEDCGHVPHREKPDVVLGLLREFYSAL
jgi:pimeloyl-ACP methyl ester carboxylesterase